MRYRSLFIAWGLALALTCVAVWLAGEKPLFVLGVLWNSAFGGTENLAYTIYYATPMVLTGTAVTLALEAGLFNIGAEGQLYMGAAFAAAWGAVTQDWFATESFASFPLRVACLAAGLFFSFLGGALWGGLAGYLRVKRQTHEVIATIMLNFIAMAFSNWIVLNPLKNLETQNLETVRIAHALEIPPIWGKLTWSAPFAALIAAAFLWATRRTWWGFRLRATGLNETAATFAGIAVTKTAMGAMALSGGIAGLVGFHEVFCANYKLHDAFSPGYGFMGVAIALLARGNIAALLLSAILFGALHKGALDLDLETDHITRDLSAVIQALILVALAAQPALTKLSFRRKKVVI